MRGAGPVGYPGAAEVVNMQPPDALIVAGVSELPCIGDGRQSGTSGSPSILNASPEAAVGGGLALLRTGDRVRIDLRARTANVLLSDDELASRRAELERTLTEDGGLPYVPPNQTPWQEIQRGMVTQLSDGMVLEPCGEVPRHRAESSVAPAPQPLTERPPSLRIPLIRRGTARWSTSRPNGRANCHPSALERL